MTMKDLGNLQRILKSAKEMQEKLQKELVELRVEGTSGGGMVSLTLDGQKNLVSVRIDPEVVNRSEVEMLQDLIVAAFNDAAAKVEEHLSQKMSSLGGAFKIPGLF
ncbi:MAG: YbaB/EbfC family nucleoid-associated protein [Acidobacteriota bacterium]